MAEPIQYKDTKAMPGSKLHDLLSAGKTKEAEAQYQETEIAYKKLTGGQGVKEVLAKRQQVREWLTAKIDQMDSDWDKADLVNLDAVCSHFSLSRDDFLTAATLILETAEFVRMRDAYEIFVWPKTDQHAVICRKGFDWKTKGAPLVPPL